MSQTESPVPSPSEPANLRPPERLCEYTRSSFIAAPVERVFAFCISPQGFEQTYPAPVRWPERVPDAWTRESPIHFLFRHWGVWVRWRGAFTRWEPNRLFTDVLHEGPFRFYEHTHVFEPHEGGTLYTDRIRFTFGLGRLVDRFVHRFVLGRTFEKRHKRMKEILERG